MTDTTLIQFRDETLKKRLFLSFQMHHANEIWFSLKDNVTYIDDSNISELKENQDTLLIVMDCLINALIILFNIFLVALILCKRNLRQKLFYWRILNLCFSDLVVGVLVLPFAISYMHNYAWIHGDTLCRAYVILDVTHFGFSALVITTMCIDRLLSKILEVYPERLKIVKYTQILIFVLPWFFSLCIFLPLLLSSVKTMGVVLDHVCGFILLDHMLVPTAVVAYLIPNIILILTTIAMLVIYKVKGNAWYRLTEEEPTGSDVTTHLRSSTIATLIVSCVTLLFCFPYLVIMFIMVTCRSHSCFPGLEVFKATIILCTLTSLFTPCLWITDDEIRSAVKQFIHSVRTFFQARTLGVRESDYNEQINEEDL